MEMKVEAGERRGGRRRLNQARAAESSASSTFTSTLSSRFSLSGDGVKAPSPERATPGVYLLHFNEKLHHAGHYLGSAADIDTRVAEHRNGSGARLTTVIKELGISFVVARVWLTETTREARLLEARFKRTKNGGRRRCPICREARA